MFYVVLGLLVLMGGISAFAGGVMSAEVMAIGLFTGIYALGMAFLFRS